ncbi:MAG: hypothetical protein M3Z01_08455, partial [Thermoproteota archaeon]|nr:hypothetical protein [Thermoproteota archaeon]
MPLVDEENNNHPNLKLNKNLGDENENFVEQIKRRKREGIEIPLTKNVQGKKNSTYLECVKLFHNALPEINFDEIDLSTTLLDKSFSA